MAVDPARVKSLFLEASDLPSPAERAAYLDRECGGEPELRARVEALLAVQDRAGPVLKPDATGGYEPTSPETLQGTAAFTGVGRPPEPDATRVREPAAQETHATTEAYDPGTPPPSR